MEGTMKKMALVSTLTLLLPTIAAAQARTTGGPRQDARASETNVQATVPFLNAVHRSGQMEIALANMAEAQGKDTRVKEYAQMLASDHRQAAQDLMKIAQAKSVTLIDDPGVSPMDAIIRLQMLKGHAFDVAFVDQMVRDHEAAIREFQQASAGNDVDVKAFAARVLPVLQKHLQAAQNLKKVI